MGFFSRLTGKTPPPPPVPAPAAPAPPEQAAASSEPSLFDSLTFPETPAAANAQTVPAQPAPAQPPADPSSSGTRPRLVAARERLEANDLPGALAIYEEVLASAGDRADVLVTISGDLGSTGHVGPIIDLVAPRYDARRHGPAAGINLLQAYLAVREPDAAQHVLDILFDLHRPELEERLHGFSNVIADLMTLGEAAGLPPQTAPGNPSPGALPNGEASGPPPGVTRTALISISKPIWFYGLEATAQEILPGKDPKARRIAFAQLALPGAYPDIEAAIKLPIDELGLLSCALPLWLAETFYFSPAYSPIAAVGSVDQGDGSHHPMIFTSDWTMENLRHLVDSAEGGLDYIFTGSLRHKAGDYELNLRVWEVKKFRERKQIVVRWTPATADAELTKFHDYLRAFMEWTPYPEREGLPYAPPTAPRAWLDALGASLDLFLVGKGLLSREQLPPLAPIFDTCAAHAFSPPASSLAWLTLGARATALGLAPPLSQVMLSSHPSVAHAQTALRLGLG